METITQYHGFREIFKDLIKLTLGCSNTLIMSEMDVRVTDEEYYEFVGLNITRLYRHHNVKLSARELDVIERLAKELSDLEIVESLRIDPVFVKVTISELFRRSFTM